MMIATEKTLSRRAQVDRWAVLIFCLVVVVVSVTAVLLLPTLLGPLLVVFVPTVTAVGLITLTAGKREVRPQLFSRAAWHISLKWVLIPLGLALLLRLGVSLLGAVWGYPFQPGALSPLLVMAFLFAAGEEIGWRGFALPRLLATGRSPLAAALLLGLPWALLHLPLTLPGKLSAGTPMLVQFLTMMAMSVLMTWAYLVAGRSLMAVVLLHGGQTMFVFLNDGLSPVVSGWLMVAVYGTAAILVILLTRSHLGVVTDLPGQLKSVTSP